MWTADNRPRYNRDKLRYPSDLTDAEWAHIEPLIPPGKPGGGKRRVAIREVINGVMYILSTGCRGARCPRICRSTVHDYLGLWNGTARWIASIMRSTSSAARKRAKPAPRPASSTVSVKSAEKGGLASTATASGRQAIKGKKRHVLVDTQGLLLHGIVTGRRSGSRRRFAPLATLFGLFPVFGKLFADSAYQGPVFHRALAGILPDLETEIVKRSDRVKGFVVQPRRWVVERTIAWLNRCRRLAKDWENLNRNALAFIKLASIRLMLRNCLILHKVSGRTLRGPALSM